MDYMDGACSRVKSNTQNRSWHSTIAIERMGAKTTAEFITQGKALEKERLRERGGKGDEAERGQTDRRKKS